MAGNFSPTITYTPISKTGRLAVSANTYDTVVSWTVSAGAVGILKEVSFVTDEVGITELRPSWSKWICCCCELKRGRVSHA